MKPKLVHADKLQPGQRIGSEPFGHGPIEEILSVESDGLQVVVITEKFHREISAACRVEVH